MLDLHAMFFGCFHFHLWTIRYFFFSFFFLQKNGLPLEKEEKKITKKKN